MSAVTITVLDAAGTPPQFTAEPDAERWVYIPRGMKPGEPWFSECESQSRSVLGWGDTLPCHAFSWSAAHDHRIRPTGGRDWSAIAPNPEPKPDYTDWVEVTAETKPEDFSCEKYEREHRNDFLTEWTPVSRDPLRWIPTNQYRIRLRNPQPAPPPAESDGEFAIRMLRGCYTRATLYQGGAAWMQRGKVEISLADALRLAAMIGGGK